MKLFQIEEPDGGPSDPDAPGAAIGIAATGPLVDVSFSVGGNAVILVDREGFEHDITVPAPNATAEAWQLLFEGARLRAERALAQPATHAVVVVASLPDAAVGAQLQAAGAAAGLTLLRIVELGEIGSSQTAVLDAAVLAEELAPRAAAP